ncbi:MAG: hypothetical protein LBM67_08000 [Lentimicrobiaceae bacterium]|jgi:hypothetical protein|nr:hypothetical protein [Lentimicrobiaceae bacterium]
MNVGIYFEQAPWLVLVVFLVGAALAALLYWNNPEQKFSKKLSWLLFALRTLTISAVGLLLLDIFLLVGQKQIDPPIVILAHDNSASLTQTKDSVYYKTTYLDDYQIIKNEIEAIYDVNHFTFGEKVSQNETIDFSEQETNLTDLFVKIRQLYYKKNVGAVVLLSDGIYNKGYAPELFLKDFEYPIYTVLLGDTATYPDLSLIELRYNKTVAKNNEFPIEISFKALNAKDQKAQISVIFDGKLVESRNEKIPSNRFSQTQIFYLKSDTEGTKKLEIELDGIDNEAQQVNNKQTVFVEVSDRKFDVLIWAKAPHPDISAIKNALGNDFKIDVLYAEDKNFEKTGYDLLVLHQLPDNSVAEKLKTLFKTSAQLPVFFILGNEVNYTIFNEIQSFLEIKPYIPPSFIDTKAVPNNNFSLFNLDKQTLDFFSFLPPISVPYATYTFKKQAETLLYQQLKNVTTSEPIISFGKSEQRKISVLAGTGIWRWRMYDFYRNQNQQRFDELLNKSLRYLLLEQDKELLKIFHETTYYSGNNIRFEAELRNQSNELVSEAEIEIEIRDEINQTTFPFVFSSNGNKYILNAGYLPQSSYSFMASTTLGNDKIRVDGRFEVLSSGLENQNLQADYNRMVQIAQQTNGKFFDVSQLDLLVETLKNDTRVTSVSRYETLFNNLIDLKWYWLLIVLLAGVEWILRKIFGSY